MKFGLTEQQYQYIQNIVESEEDISSNVGKIQESLENGYFPYIVEIVQNKDFAESYRESFEKDKVEL